MNKEEKERLRKEYNALKRTYRSLKSDMKSVIPDSQEMYETRQNLCIVGYQISQIRSSLIEATIGRLNPANLIDNFIFGDDEEYERGGR